MNKEVLLKGKIRSIIMILVISLFALLSCQNSPHPAKEISLNPLFTDSMVLQRNQEIPIWGKSEPGGEVVVTLK